MVVGATVGGGRVVACSTRGSRSIVRTGGVAATALEPDDEHDDEATIIVSADATGRNDEATNRSFDAGRVVSPCRTTVSTKVVTVTGRFADTHVTVALQGREMSVVLFGKFEPDGESVLDARAKRFGAMRMGHE